MRKTLIIVGTLLVASLLVLGACAPASSPSTTPTTPAAPTPSAEPTPAPIPSPPPSVSAATIEITDVTTVPSRGGGGHFLGFVNNVGTPPVGEVILTLSLYNKAGALIAQGRVWLFDSLHPGERYPFRVSPEVQPLEPWDRYEITFKIYPYRKTAARLCPELRVVGDRWEEEGVIRGTLQNTSQKTAENIRISAAGYDNEGRLIAVSSYMRGASTIPPDVSAAFEVRYWTGETSKVTDYKLFISARLKD